MDRARVAESLERECAAFLYREAELLDRWHFGEWLKLLSPAIEYRVPVRTTRTKKDGDGFSRSAFLMDEDLGSLELRVKRLESDQAWSENPRTRTRRMLANLRVAQAADGAEVTSNIAVYCHRGDEPHPVVFTGERQDVLERTTQGLRLRRRLVLLDTTVIGADAFSIFL